MKLNIVFRKKDHDLFISFWKKFETKLDCLKNVVIENTDESINLSYEIPPHSSRLTNKVIKLWLADSMGQYFKEIYLHKNLILPKKTEIISFGLLVKALTIFDKATDTEEIYKAMGELKNFNVYSYYVFRMGDMRLRWQEICDLFSKSIPGLIHKNAFIELMRYLLMVTDSGVGEATLDIEGNYFMVRDKDNKNLIDPINILDETGESRALFELISLAPKNIYIRFDIHKNARLASTINNLFESKIVYCT